MKNVELTKIQFDNRVSKIEDIKAQIKELEAAKKKVEEEIKNYLDAHDLTTFETNNHKVTWTLVQSERLDTKKLKSELPDIYNKFSSPSSCKRFSVIR